MKKREPKEQVELCKLSAYTNIKDAQPKPPDTHLAYEEIRYKYAFKTAVPYITPDCTSVCLYSIFSHSVWYCASWLILP